MEAKRRAEYSLQPSVAKIRNTVTAASGGKVTIAPIRNAKTSAKRASGRMQVRNAVTK